jgi:glutaredoxin-like protein
MMLNDKVRDQVRKKFESLQNPVKLIVFTQEFECNYCHDARTIAEELAELSDKVSTEVYDFQQDAEKVKAYRIDKIPAIAVEGERDYGVRFFGVPGGYEFSSLLESVRLVSEGKSDLSEDTMKFLGSLTRDLHFQVFVTPTCPYCPRAVVLAHNLAVASDKVRADMVEVSEFMELAVKYQVQGVPRTVVNETIAMEGAVPEQMLVDRLKNELN